MTGMDGWMEKEGRGGEGCVDGKSVLSCLALSRRAKVHVEARGRFALRCVSWMDSPCMVPSPPPPPLDLRSRLDFALRRSSSSPPLIDRYNVDLGEAKDAKLVLGTGEEPPVHVVPQVMTYPGPSGCERPARALTRIVWGGCLSPTIVAPSCKFPSSEKSLGSLFTLPFQMCLISNLSVDGPDEDNSGPGSWFGTPSLPCSAHAVEVTLCRLGVEGTRRAIAVGISTNAVASA
ncbi:hypothetical protein AXG93_1838s1130 [Marchantia polymorpha subsp. ruderalis]|uniref:Uncharacterized protein n=1 Tax=Marchantia polymorpha subsp. ruderalis TaxID=1480154 RepID=A0A176WGR7_MARPO|nr:hypothetical protein AXG93_1838s1130 [Marchantia polymorpha subsp. ruderalis]